MSSAEFFPSMLTIKYKSPEPFPRYPPEMEATERKKKDIVCIYNNVTSNKVAFYHIPWYSKSQNIDTFKMLRGKK